MAAPLTRVALAILALCAGCESGNQGSRIAPGVTVLHGVLEPAIRSGTDMGRMDPGTRLEGMSLTFTPGGTRAERDALLVALQSAGSPMYHRWLTPEQYADRFGASAADVARVSGWLQEQGLEVIGPSRGRTSLFFSGTVGQLERALRTELHHYDISGEQHFAPSMEPSIPAPFGDLVLGLRNVHDLRPRARSHRTTPDYKTGSTYQLAPADWATIYDVARLYALTPAIDGKGQKIAIVGQSTVNTSDLQGFRTKFGLDPANLPVEILVPHSGSPTIPSPQYQDEASLDLEWSGAVAKSATLEYVYAGDSPNYSVYDAAFYAIDSAIAPILSFSYGGCEAGYSPTEAAYLGAMGDFASMLGITFVVAAGDGGAAGCDEFNAAARYGLSAGYPASMPGAVAVGGTLLLAQPTSMYFDANSDAVSYIPEVGWNDTLAAGSIFGGSGGVSIVFPKPYWQVGVTFNDGMRDMPDVALASSAYQLPYVVEINGSDVSFGGTSCAAPSFAGVLALVNEALAGAHPMAPVGLGNANPVLYALAGNAATASAFHDIVQGNNIVPCAVGSPDCPASPPYRFGYSCKAGYDLVTGNGSIDAYDLVQAWMALIPTGTLLNVLLPQMTEGSPMTLTAAISSTGTTAPLTGDVVFYYGTLSSGGYLDVAQPLGAVPVTPTMSGGMQAATAQLVTHAPPGLTGTSTVSAFYAGDLHYLASWSATQQVKAKSTLAVVPASASADRCGTVQFKTTGGAPPVTWDYWSNSSSGSIGINSGMYQAGDAGGVTDTVVAMDTYGAQALATVSVSTRGCASDAGASVDSSAPMDAGVAAADARTAGDGSTGDSVVTVVEGRAQEPSCSCRQVGGGTPGALGGVLALAGTGVLGLRRRRLRGVSWVVLRDRSRYSSDTCGCATPPDPRRAPSPW